MYCPEHFFLGSAQPGESARMRSIWRDKSRKCTYFVGFAARRGSQDFRFHRQVGLLLKLHAPCTVELAHKFRLI